MASPALIRLYLLVKAAAGDTLLGQSKSPVTRQQQKLPQGRALFCHESQHTLEY